MDSSERMNLPVGNASEARTLVVARNQDQAGDRRQRVAREVGTLLIVSGIAGMLLPGPVGTPLLILGCVIVWPRGFRPMQRFFEKQFPRTHRLGALQSERFLSDLERRYPFSR